ncbi:MAG: hypothetical protein GF411_14670 [Candidatus Lokiarchaeota archaeon]|nr:hypothetical protein [Candidatus Lokiarchaeota archaeon]
MRKWSILVVVLSVLFIAAYHPRANQRPVIVSKPPLEFTPGVNYIYAPQAREPDGDPIYWRLERGPSGSFVIIDFVHNYRPILVWDTRHAKRRRWHYFRLVADDGKWGQTRQWWIVKPKQ